MMPIGPLMMEHRLIERMIKFMKGKLEESRLVNKVDPNFIDMVIDFFRMYADRCHHGKEEDILFRELKKKKLSPEHAKIVEELIEEHVRGREMVGNLSRANQEYRQGESESIALIAKFLEKLVDFYPAHIAKEDKKFFLPIMEQFNKKEQAAMLEEFWEFDRKLIHEKYTMIVRAFEKR